MAKDQAIIPIVNEKTYELSKSKNVFVFKVPLTINKPMVAKAVKAQFEVDVETVNIARIKGKVKRTMSLTGKRAMNASGKRPDFKKAYVSIKKGQSLPFFESVDEAEEKREVNQEKFDKVARKQAEKETKSKKTTDAAPKRRFSLSKRPEGK
jgi:large subunit ribosomal protein L23